MNVRRVSAICWAIYAVALTVGVACESDATTDFTVLNDTEHHIQISIADAIPSRPHALGPGEELGIAVTDSPFTMSFEGTSDGVPFSFELHFDRDSPYLVSQDPLTFVVPLSDFVPQ